MTGTNDLFSFQSEKTFVLEPKKTSYSGKTHFVIKVQAPRISFERSGAQLPTTGPLMVYNKDRKICGHVEQSEPCYKDLLEAVRGEEMFGGLKAYFYAIVDKDMNLSINFKRRLTPELW